MGNKQITFRNKNKTNDFSKKIKSITDDKYSDNPS